MRYLTPLVVSAGLAFAATTVLAGDAPRVAGSTANDKKDEEVIVLSPFEITTSVGSVGGAFLGATPGGFQDIAFGRTLLEWGMLPRPGEITAEGLFSEFDLPTPEAESGGRLLSITGDAKAASILNKPGVTHLAQIGFASGLDARTWKRDPVFLVVVADVSGSMSGNLPLLQQSIRTIVAKLGPQDAFALVSFADDVQLDRAPERVTATTAAVADSLAIRGGTNIEAGLKLGFEIAQTKVAGFTGRTRVVLITDAMPNIGATSAGSFMAQAEAASLAGTGLTTIGVGLQFSAEFVKHVSSVSGGNAFYFPDAGQMKTKLDNDFDFMVTELAFDIEIRIDPAPGLRLVDVYGLPGDVYVRTPEGGLVMDLKTLFLSRERGAIFVSLAADHPVSEGMTLGRAGLTYSLYGASAPEHSEFLFTLRSEKRTGLGLSRGEMLINEYEALQAAGTAFYETGDLAAASIMATTLAEMFATDPDQGLARERELLENLSSFLALAVQQPELGSGVFRARSDRSPLLGVWRFSEESDAAVDDEISAPSEYLLFLPCGQVAFLDDTGDETLRVVPWKGRNLGNGRGPGVTLAVDKDQLTYRAVDRESRKKAKWHLQRCAPNQPWLQPEEPEVEVTVNEEDASYVASPTLAGTRLQTDLRDVASVVTVVTHEFLSDVQVAEEGTSSAPEADDDGNGI